MSWLRKHVLGDPAVMADFRRAQQALAAHVPAAAEPDELLWKLDMRVLELSKTLPYLRRRNLSLA